MQATFICNNFILKTGRPGVLKLLAEDHLNCMMDREALPGNCNCSFRGMRGQRKSKQKRIEPPSFFQCVSETNPKRGSREAPSHDSLTGTIHWMTCSIGSGGVTATKSSTSCAAPTLVPVRPEPLSAAAVGRGEASGEDAAVPRAFSKRQAGREVER